MLNIGPHLNLRYLSIFSKLFAFYTAGLHLLKLISFLQRNTVAYEEGQPRDLEEALVLRDAISDLPAVRLSSLLEILFNFGIHYVFI